MADLGRPQEDRDHVRHSGAGDAAARLCRRHHDALPAGIGVRLFARLSAAPSLRSGVHRPRHDHDLFHGDAVSGRLDECRRAAADRSARRGLPVHERGQPVADGGRRHAGHGVARHRRFLAGRVARLSAAERAAIQPGQRRRLLDLGDPVERHRHADDRHQLSGHDPENAGARHDPDAHAGVHVDGVVHQHPDRPRLSGVDRNPGAADAGPLSRHAFFHRRPRRQPDDVHQSLLDVGTSGSLHPDPSRFRCFLGGRRHVFRQAAVRLFHDGVRHDRDHISVIYGLAASFFTMGASANVNAFFAITTGVKIFNWLFTMYRGRVRFTTPMLWTLGFIVTFTIGGMSGVLLAVPPADFVLHNSELVVAHFHNVLIPGSLFGYFAGYAYWFPKAFGFRLDERWGRRAFWAWLVGFYVAFMPLYILRLMGMPRRMDYDINPAWHPYLEIAALGAAIIALGIACQIAQLVASFRKRAATRDLSGDPWDGRTLEWSLPSPPPFYNFARIPVVRDRDAFADMKQRGAAYRRPARYHDIHMPKNTAAGFLIGVFAFLFGFAMVWHIWWLAASGAFAILALVVARATREDTDYTVPAAEVERIETLRYRRLAAAGIIPAEPQGGEVPAFAPAE